MCTRLSQLLLYCNTVGEAHFDCLHRVNDSSIVICLFLYFLRGWHIIVPVEVFGLMGLSFCHVDSED